MYISEIIFNNITSNDLSNIFSLIIQSTITIFSIFFVVSMFLMENEKYKNSAYSKLILGIKCKINFKKIVFVSCIVVLLTYIALLFNTFYEFNDDLYNWVYVLISASCIILFILLMILFFYCFYQLYLIYNLGLLEDIEQEKVVEEIESIKGIIEDKILLNDLYKKLLHYNLSITYKILRHVFIYFMAPKNKQCTKKNIYRCYSKFKLYFKENIISVFKEYIRSKRNIAEDRKKLHKLEYINKKKEKILMNENLCSCFEDESEIMRIMEEAIKKAEAKKEEVEAKQFLDKTNS